MKILVTGSSGTIGTRLCETLLEQGHDVVGADWEPNKWKPELDAITHKMDLREKDAMNDLPKDFDIVIHLAANARVYELVIHPERAMDNFITLFNALEFTRKNSIKRFIFASSRESYGNIDVEKYSEDMADVQNCESPYTASKIGGEALVRSYGECYDMDILIFRFSNVYGMYDDSVRVVPEFFRRARNKEVLTVFGEKKCLDFTYIDDCIDGIILGIEKFDAAKGDVYNLAYGEGTTLIRLAESINELMDSPAEIKMGEVRTGEVVNYVADISKAQKVLGYSPKVSFDEGIRKSIEWYKANV